MSDNELIYTMALTRIGFFNFQTMLELYRQMGSGSEIFEHRGDIQDIVPDCSPRLAAALKDWSEPLRRAEEEMEYCHDHGIAIYCLGDGKYPQRLAECADAPIVLYYKGEANLNKRNVINIVGTRHCTTYGADVIARFTRELKSLCPDVLIVSGLAYGVDVNAHRRALDNGFETVGVLAHGLDYLYPHVHKPIANEMVGHGGLLTEFMTNTKADKPNFIRRNRIVAGMSDACILIESAARGGGLITAGIAQSYSRDVFAVPGRLGDKYSEGCNRIIRDNIATMLTSAEEFVKAMGWENDSRRTGAMAKGIERQLFPELTAEQRLIVDVLTKTDDLQINIIATKTNMPIHKVAALLFEMEMLGVVKPLAGGTYHLLK